MSQDTVTTKYYFAYGSNLCPDQMRRRCPGAKPAGTVKLEKHRLTFPLHSNNWKAGVAGIEPHDEEHVEGVLYELTEEHFEILDRYEAGYTRGRITVRCVERGDIEALTYHPDPHPGGPFDPSDQYLGTMLRGAKAHGLSSQWIERLTMVTSLTPADA